MPYTVLGLGSNRHFNDLTPLEVLGKACAELTGLLQNVKVSHVYRTAPMYVQNQDDFYNLVAFGYFEGSCQELLYKIHLIENKYGRNRKSEIRNGPRSLDIDIEVFGKEIISTEELEIPHPRLFERAFVLKPMLEIISENTDISKDFIKKAEVSLQKLSDQRIQRV